jgi:hypothetical protein
MEMLVLDSFSGDNHFQMPRSRVRPKARKRSRKAKKDWKTRAGLALSVVGLWGLIPFVEARPLVFTEPPLDPDNVLTTPFEIRNDGEMSLHDVKVVGVIGHLTQKNNIHVSNGMGWNSFTDSPEIKPKETETLAPLHHLYESNIPILSGEVTIVVLCRPSFWPFTLKRGFKFSIARQSDGHLRLVPQPAGDVVEQYEKAHKTYAQSAPG